MGKSLKLKKAVKNLDRENQNAEKKYLLDRNEICREQMNAIAEAKRKYFVTDSINGEDSQIKVSEALGALGINLYGAYLPYVSEFYLPMYELDGKFNPANRIMYFDITKWVKDSEEKNIDKLINVYQVLSGTQCNIALIFDRKVGYCNVTIALVNTGNNSMPSVVSDYCEHLNV